MSELTNSEAGTPEANVTRSRQAAVETVGAVACITLGEEIGLAQLLNGTVSFTTETVIYDRSGAEIDAEELLSLVEGGF